MLRPVTLPCGHSGCQDCLSKLVAVQAKPRCPQCKDEIPNRLQLNINMVLHNLTRNLELSCTNNGCAWKGPYEDYEGHTRACGKLEVKCSNEGCGHVDRREDMGGHLLLCPKQTIACKECGVNTTRDNPEHWCSHQRISCPLSCGETLPRYGVVKISKVEGC